MEYTISETLHQGGCTSLYRAFRPGTHSSVVLKVVDPRRCRPKDLEQLRHEYEIGASLETPKIVRPRALDSYQGMPALVFEDSGGVSLERLLEGPMGMEEFLELAISVASAVAELHRQGVIHKDLNPENILVDPATNEVKLAGFGLATRLPREQQAVRPPQLIEGTLPYMSPEQTGRMNRAIDSRSDLYSLGITFYQMLAGRLPFEARDPLEWIHCHVARVPAPPSQLAAQGAQSRDGASTAATDLAAEVPGAIDRIVLKLLAKMADDRYQTARGLQNDLTRCLEQWRERGCIDPFPLGERDVPDRLRIPQKLYGRDAEVTELLSAFERAVDGGSPELVLVSGYSGIGKSSLVHELQKPVLHRRGLFSAGKFDQYKREIPYSTIAQAFRDLVLEILAEGEERVVAWRQRLQRALGINAQLIVDMIPQLELVIGKQPAVPELPLSEAKNRFHMVFRQFLGVFAREEHPLTLFLDDLQWADSASLELLAETLTHPETHHLLAVGAYRDNEVTAAHPLMMTLEGLRKTPLTIRELVLAPLSREHLSQLIGDALLRPPRDFEELTSLVDEKTAGNPFFAIQFLTSLQDDGLIRFDPDTLAWRCDIASARARGYTDNVVDLMVGKLRRLSPEAQEAAKIAACAGNVTDAATLSVLRGRSEDQIDRDQWELVREGLLLRSGATYRFSHDRVQQAAYALIPEDERPRRHLTLGRLLLAHTPPGQLGERVFEIVNQLNRGARLIEDHAERWRLAELDLLAGRRAKTSTAYGPASEVLAAGMAMLPDDAWRTRHDLTYALHFERAQCEYLHGNFAEAERCLTLALHHARSRAERVAGHRLRIEVYTTRGEVEKAVENLLQCLAMFGLALERHPPAEIVQERYAQLIHSLGDRRIEDLLDLPPISDPDVHALLEALVAALPVAYFCDQRLFFFFAIATDSVRLSIEHGNSASSPAAYSALGTLLGPLLGKYRDGYGFGKLGHDLVERHEFVAKKAETWLLFGYHGAFWTRHVSATLPFLEEGMRAGAETGCLNYASYSACHLVTVLLARGDALAEVDRRSERMLEFVREARHGDAEDYILSQRRLIHRLRGLPSDAGDDPGMEGLDARIQGRIPTAVCSHHVRSLQAAFLLGDLRGAFSAAARVRGSLWASTILWETCEHSYYLALTVAALHAGAPPREQEEHLRALRAEIERHRVWAENCRENFENRHALLSAELARLERRELDAERLYERAIQSAHEEGFVQNEALAHELASRFYRARGLVLIADAYLREARSCYVRWGADAKVKQIDQQHPHLLGPRSGVPSVHFAARPEQLDVLAVAKGSQTISSEILLDSLVRTLLRVVLEEGGAQRGSLLLAHDGLPSAGSRRGLAIVAEATLDDRGVQATVVEPVPLESSSARIPASIVKYVQRTKERVVLDDPAAGGRFLSDDYIARARPRSALCLPIVRQAEVVGVLYLENNLLAGAFTPERLTALELLATQAAISVENASLLAKSEAAKSRFAFLAEAGAFLSESLDYEKTLAQVARLCVQSIADWCVIDVLSGETGEMRRLAGAHRDPAKEPLLQALHKYPPRWDSLHPAAEVLRKGEPLVVPEWSDEGLRGACYDDEHAHLVRELGVRSTLSVPLLARGQLLGVISLCSAPPGRPYGPADLGLAQEVAHRAAIAIDNARLYGEAQEGIRRREEFLAVASHELRTPMAGFMLSLEALVASTGEEQVLARNSTRRLLEILVRQGRRLAGLVGTMLDVSKLQKRPSLELAEIELGAVVRGAVGRLERELTQAGCPLSIQASEPVTGRWDRSRLDHVVTNLLSNAIKFGAGKPIEIHLYRRAGMAYLSVRDHGMGIDPAHHARIFDRFERAVSSDHYGGLGLGLYISRLIVDAHGGSIRLESRPGTGATFTVELPCAGPGEAATRAGD